MVGFAPDEIDPSLPTRAARLKWVIVVAETVTGGRAVNAAVCAAAATARAVDGILGPAATDADGSVHEGLPWLGCSVLSAPADRLADIRRRAASADDMHVADAPVAAQSTRVYAEYLDSVAGTPTDGLELLAVSIVGPRSRVDRLVGRLALLA